jgi:hypothetical protein
MMIFEESTASLFPSELFIQSGDNKLVITEDLLENMINLYRGAGILASEEPVRETTKRLVNIYVTEDDISNAWFLY